MKTSIITISETRVTNYIKASYKGRTVILPYKDRWKLHPGYVEPTYLNSLEVLRELISSKYDEFVVSNPNPYPFYGTNRELVWKHYLFKRECITPYMEWLISLLREIDDAGGCMNYNHPRMVARLLRYSLYEIHSVFGYHYDMSPISLEKIHSLIKEFKLNEDYPQGF